MRLIALIILFLTNIGNATEIHHAYLKIEEGTVLSVYPPISKEYETKKDKWGNILNYMAYYYTKSAPLLEDESRDTFYLPFKVNQDNHTSYLVMVDIRKITFVNDDTTPHFITIKSTTGLPTHLFKWKKKDEILLHASAMPTK